MLHISNIFSINNSTTCLIITKGGFVIIFQTDENWQKRHKSRGGSSSDFDNGKRARTSMSTAAWPGGYFLRFVLMEARVTAYVAMRIYYWLIIFLGHLGGRAKTRPFSDIDQWLTCCRITLSIWHFGIHKRSLLTCLSTV